MNAKLRAWNLIFVGTLTVGALVGWMFFDKNPAQLVGLAGALGIAQVGLEASMVGKRATTKPEVMVVEAQIAKDNGTDSG